MATDPTRSIQKETFESPLDLNPRDALIRLAALEPSLDAPYLTVSLDWQPLGSRPDQRPGRAFLTDEGEKLLASLEAHSPAHESVSADLVEIAAYIDGLLDLATHGIFVVACSARGVFEPLALNVPLTNDIRIGPTPALSRLAKLADDFATYAVLLADQTEATLSFISQGQHERNVALEATGYPRKQTQGGFSQRRFQSRADERVQAFAKDVAAETRKALDEVNASCLILAGAEEMTVALNEALHETAREKIVASIPMDIRATESEIIEATMPLAERAEREREAHTVQQVRDNLGPGGLAVAGVEPVLAALQSGQVLTLVMNDDFRLPGWADFTLPVYGVGNKPRQHPAGGNPGNMAPVTLEDEVVRLAVQTGADVEIVRSAVPIQQSELDQVPDAGDAKPRARAARDLDAIGGVGALLRFALATEQSTAEM